jgi:N-acetylmuramoyl-L-alanine amidase
MGRNLTVVLDAGHGGHDSGAVGPRGTREADVALAVALMCGGLLQAAGITVVWTRRTDEFLSLTQRADRANDVQADAFVSIHCNSGEPGRGEGYEVWTTPGQTRGDALATCLFEAWRSTFPSRRARMDITDGDPDKEAGFAVIRKTRMAAALFELEFIHTPRGEEWLAHKTMQAAMAAALASGILTFLGVTSKS